MKFVMEIASKIYAPGSTISGSINCSFSTKTEVEAIKVVVKGVEKLNLGRRGRRSSELFYVLYKEEVLTIASDGTGNKSFKGSYSFPFRIDLPPVLPSSILIHRVGWISYSLEAFLSTPYNLHNKRARADIIIHSSSIKLSNHAVKYHGSYTNVVEKSFHCFRYQRGVLTFEVAFPKRVFVFNEPICFKITVDNQTKLKISSVKVKALGKIYFKRVESDKLLRNRQYAPNLTRDLTVCQDKIPCGVYTWDVELKTPSVNKIPNFQGSKLYEFVYELQIKVNMGLCISVMQKVFTKLGHVPLNETTKS